METSPIAGKLWQPNNEPLHKRAKIGTHHTDKTLERQGGTGEGKQPLRRVSMLRKTLTKSKTAVIPLGPITGGILVLVHI